MADSTQPTHTENFDATAQHQRKSKWAKNGTPKTLAKVLGGIVIGLVLFTGGVIVGTHADHDKNVSRDKDNISREFNQSETGPDKPGENRGGERGPGGERQDRKGESSDRENSESQDQNTRLGDTETSEDTGTE